LIALVLAAAVVEVAARVAQPMLTSQLPPYYFRNVFAALTVADPVYGIGAKPGAHVELRNSAGAAIGYHFNHIGWRDKEFNPIEMPGNAIVFGGTYAFGLGVREQDRFTEKMEENFRGLDVWNLAMPGYAPDQALLQAERWLPPVPWKFAILQISDESLAAVAAHTWRDIHSGTGIPAAVVVPSLPNSFSEGWNLLATFGFQGMPPEASLEDGLKRLVFSVREIAKLSNVLHIPFIVMQASEWGPMGAKLSGEYHDRLVELARAENFSLMEAGLQERLPMPDLHWTAVAHKKVADSLSPEIYKILFPTPVKRKATR
jgi:hypothetical protein